MKGFETYILESVSNIKGDVVKMFASLRAAESIHRESYWKAKGENHYGMHLMFKHINDPIDDQLNELGNQFVARLGEEILSGREIEAKAKEYVLKANSETNAVDRSLWIEKIIQDNIKSVYGSLKSSGELTLGLDELLMGIAKEHDDAIYHLTRTQG